MIILKSYVNFSFWPPKEQTRSILLPETTLNTEKGIIKFAGETCR